MRSGRTTRMLEWAIARAREGGKVRVVALDAMHCRTLHSMLHRLVPHERSGESVDACSVWADGCIERPVGAGVVGFVPLHVETSATTRHVDWTRVFDHACLEHRSEELDFADPDEMSSEWHRWDAGEHRADERRIDEFEFEELLSELLKRTDCAVLVALSRVRSDERDDAESGASHMRVRVHGCMFTAGGILDAATRMIGNSNAGAKTDDAWPVR